MSKCEGCGAEYQRLYRHTVRCPWLITPEVFLIVGRVNARDPEACWIWKSGGDYGKFGTDRAHRQAYRIFKRVEPGDLDVCHTCDTPGCVNPAHLFLGTASDNVKDAVAKGRHYTPWGDPSVHVRRVSGDDHYTRRNPEIARQRVNAMLAARGIQTGE